MKYVPVYFLSHVTKNTYTVKLIAYCLGTGKKMTEMRLYRYLTINTVPKFN